MSATVNLSLAEYESITKQLEKLSEENRILTEDLIEAFKEINYFKNLLKSENTYRVKIVKEKHAPHLHIDWEAFKHYISKNNKILKSKESLVEAVRLHTFNYGVDVVIHTEEDFKGFEDVEKDAEKFFYKKYEEDAKKYFSTLEKIKEEVNEEYSNKIKNLNSDISAKECKIRTLNQDVSTYKEQIVNIEKTIKENQNKFERESRRLYKEKLSQETAILKEEANKHSKLIKDLKDNFRNRPRTLKESLIFFGYKPYKITKKLYIIKKDDTRKNNI